ncbi:6-phosphogluconolactonase [Seminavis robusta]|uniref:6-phosphogluconolactonase n=1 Tax=Seminavis robusta TaxID=568900 RepID=A0A9N8H952_9STRA|nr:6-phosphogluconolactonase [Seminavis robusta]|eukprot:Sro243_g096920.1 6-phosphogluconolactonase (378) ;mRNA; f:48175-49308
MSNTTVLIHVGTCFGDDDSPTKAVLRLSLATDTGILSEAGKPISIDGGINPGWISRYVKSNSGHVVYIGLEDDPGTAQAFELDGSNLKPLGSPLSSEGRHPCYCQLDTSGKWLFAANYSSGTVSVLPVQQDGSLGKPTDSKTLEGPLQADLQDRQEASHAHCIIPHPTNKFVVACDLGLSKVFVFGFDAERGLLSNDDGTRHLTMPADAGCRHCCWDATGETLFVVNELNYTLTAASFDVETGILKEVRSVYLLRDGDKADRAHHRGASDIALHPNGNFVYVGCRSPSPGVICILQVQGKGKDCQLSVVGHESTRGEVPRNFKLIRDGTWFVVGNQEGKNVVSYAVNSNNGMLEFKSEISTAPYKACNIASPDALNA